MSDGMSGASLSVCIIAKDEEFYIGRLLDSLHGCPEIIVLDTGSTDRTREVASSYRGVRVANFVWTGSFSDARNAVADLATSEFVMWLDADMWFESGEFEKILDLVRGASAQVDAIVLRVVDRGSVTLSPRIYRKSNLRFSGSVHEQISARSAVPTTFRVMHQREEDPVARAAKEASYQKLLEDELAQDPKSIHALVYMRDIAMARADWDSAKKFCFELLHLERPIDYFNYLTLSRITYNRGEYDNARRYGATALEHCATDPRVFLTLGNAFEALGRSADAMVLYVTALNMPPEARLIASKYSIEDDAYNVLPLVSLGWVYARSGNVKAAEMCLRRAIAINPSTQHREKIELGLRDLFPKIDSANNVWMLDNANNVWMPCYKARP